MSEMIERVAQAISETNINTVGLRYTELMHAMARAAIVAMREPTEKMWNAPVMADVFVSGVYPSGEESEAIWRAMIDEALK